MENNDGLTTQSNTLRDTLTALTDQAEAGEPLSIAPPEPVETPASVETPDTAAPAGETAEQKAGRTAGRARDAQGKLLPGKAVKPVEAAHVTPEPPFMMSVASAMI